MVCISCADGVHLDILRHCITGTNPLIGLVFPSGPEIWSLASFRHTPPGRTGRAAGNYMPAHGSSTRCPDLEQLGGSNGGRSLSKTLRARMADGGGVTNGLSIVVYHRFVCYGCLEIVAG